MNQDRSSQRIIDLFNEVISMRFTKAEDYYKLCDTARDLPCLEGFFKFFATVNSILADYEFNLYSLVRHQDTIMAGYFLTGPSRKKFPGQEPSLIITASGIDLFRLDGEKINTYMSISHQIKVPSGNRRELVMQR